MTDLKTLVERMISHYRNTSELICKQVEELIEQCAKGLEERARRCK